MKRRYHLHIPAVLFFVLVLLVGLVAARSGSNLLYGIFGLLFSGLIISGLVSGVMMLGIRIKRFDPPHIAVGEPLIVQYKLSNRNRFVPIFNVHIEEMNIRFPGASESGAAPASTSAWVMHVGPGETVHGETSFWPEHRGEVRFAKLRVWTTFPFGLIKKSVTLDQPQRALVYPRLYELRRGVLRSIDTPGPIGARITNRPGGSDDYFGLREYRTNDSVRHIAWKRSAQSDQLVCIERSMPSPPRLRVVLDLSTPTDQLRLGDAELERGLTGRELEERAISLAASIIHQASFEGYEVGLTVMGIARAHDESPEAEFRANGASLHLPMRRNHWHPRRLLGVLAGLDLDGPRVRAHPSIAESERAGLVVLHPDRVSPISNRGDVTYLTGRQLDRLAVGPLGWVPEEGASARRASEREPQPEGVAA